MPTDSPDGTVALAEALDAVLIEVLPQAGAVRSLRRLSGGASRETWSLDAGDRPLVLRRDRPSSPAPAAMAREAECFRAAAGAGVPVPQLVAVGDGSDGVGSPYLLMERLDGESLPQRLLRDERWAPVRARLAGELGSILARIHAVDLGQVPSLQRFPDRLAWLRDQHDAFGEARPATELALRWLADHRPPAVADAFVHGDYRNGNLIIDDAGVRAVLDWELAHVGDPREDLGWLCAKAWRFGSDQPVGGFGSREELYAGYEQVAGVRPDPAAVHWWEVFACVYWAVICRLQVERQVSGVEQTVEMAIVGRRVAEAEFDALLALGLAEPQAVDDLLLGPALVPDPVLQARPTTDEMLAAVAGYLRDEHTASDPRDAYLARVAANAVAIVRRSLRAGPAEAAYRARLGAIGCADDTQLARAIRTGRLAINHPGVVDAVVAGVVTQLAEANPRYLAQPQ